MTKRVLLVDDDPEILDLFEIYLYSSYEVITAENGFEALQKSKKLKPDCVITDIMMPTLDGIKFFNRFRKIEGLENVPVIAITAFTENLQEKSLRNIGFVTVLPKPITRHNLLHSLAEVLED